VVESFFMGQVSSVRPWAKYAYAVADGLESAGARPTGQVARDIPPIGSMRKDRMLIGWGRVPCRDNGMVECGGQGSVLKYIIINNNY
jgi:hypothetical protein